MATRKSLVLISGLTQELNSSSDKLDFAGNSTSDLSEGTNQYFTNARSRGAVSVASGNGLTYNSSTGVLGTSAIPNSQLANSSITLGATGASLGQTVSTISGLTSLTSTTIVAGSGANAILLASGSIQFEGSTANDFETSLTVTDPTADRTITFPDATGTVALTSDIVYPVTLNNSVTLTNKTLTLGSNTISGTLAQFNTAVTDATLVSTTGSETLTNKSVNLANNTLTGTFAQFNTAVSNATLVSTTGTETLTNKSLTAPTLTGSSSSAGSIIFKEDTDNGTNSATLVGPAATADVTLTLPAETGTVLTTASSIANSNLANSSLTIGSTGVALGGSATSFTGLASITSTAVVTNDSGFRIRNNSDNTKIGAFSSASITGGQTRTLTFPDSNGTIATQSYVTNAIAGISADITAVNAGTGLSGGGSSGAVTLAIDSTVTTLTGSQTLTNKSLTSPAITGSLSGDAFLDEDNFSSDSATKVASQQSIKAYVATQIATVPVGDITAVTAGTGLSGGGTSGAVTLNLTDHSADLLTSGTIPAARVPTLNQNTTGSAATLTTARTIGGVSFDGSANINLPGVNASGSQDTTGNAATATALETARNIGGVSFDGTGNINLPGVNTSGSQNTSGTAAIATTVTVADESSDTTCFPLFATAATGNLAPKSGSNLAFNSSSGVLTATGFAGALTGNVTGNISGSSGSTTGNAATATALANARTIAGVSFDGTANISLNNNAITNGAGYLTAVATGNIADDAVTYAKIQNVSATNRILGRDSSGAGAIEEITPANLRTMINVEDGADVTDATNVNAAGAVMNSDTSIAAMQFVVDEDNMSSDSATKVPTQQSVKAYVDANAGGSEFADNVFRVKDNSDATKKLAFECSGISGSTTRTLTVPDNNGTIGTEDFATAIAVALG